MSVPSKVERFVEWELNDKSKVKCCINDCVKADSLEERGSLNSKPLLGNVCTVKGSISEIIWSAVFDLINLLGEISAHAYICFSNVTLTILYAYLIKPINIVFTDRFD